MDTIQKKKMAVISAYQRLFSTDDGMMVLEDLSKSCGFLSSAMGRDPYETAFNEGERSVFVRIVTTIETDFDKLLKLAEKEVNNNDQEDF